MAETTAPGQTPWQTVGPFFHYALPWKGGADLIEASELGARTDLFPPDHDQLHVATARGAVAGERIEIVGRVLDAAGAPCPDAMIEIWQANAGGRYASPLDARAEIALDAGFIGFGRSSTTIDGEFRFKTIKPGRTPGPGNAWQAPHIAVGVFGRGLINRLVTRIYFGDEASNAEDPVLELVPPSRRGTLIARPDGAANVYRLNIRLQGDQETVFFDV